MESFHVHPAYTADKKSERHLRHSASIYQWLLHTIDYNEPLAPLAKPYHRYSSKNHNHRDRQYYPPFRIYPFHSNFLLTHPNLHDRLRFRQKSNPTFCPCRIAFLLRHLFWPPNRHQKALIIHRWDLQFVIVMQIMHSWRLLNTLDLQTFYTLHTKPRHDQLLHQAVHKYYFSWVSFSHSQNKSSHSSHLI
ncbi:hypothetical protein D3C80_1215670 [compost metagenome]